MKYSCMYLTNTGVIGDEDCLYINVHVPREKPTPSDNLNVIVHIHGGGFAIWDANFYAGEKYLMDEDVIFVTMNYRLGIFGFLSTEDLIIPGNNGMKDQALALVWIQKNIKYFGGNPGSVTITGMSAGGASVHLHYFSPLSRGLFHRGVSQSGTALDSWVVPGSQLKVANQLGEKLGCPTETSTELRDCLRTRSAKYLVSSSPSLLIGGAINGLMFSPVVEKVHEGAFLTEHPYKLLLEGNVADVPWISGTNEGEGAFAIYLSSPSPSDFFKNFDLIIPRIAGYHDIDDEQKEAITNKIKDFYFNQHGHSHGHEDIGSLIQLITDKMFLSGADRSAKLQAKVNKSPVYSYIFGYRGQHSFMDHFLPNTDHIGTSHGDDVLYYLHTAIAEKKLSEPDEQMKSVFMHWLTNYAETDEPKIEGKQWKAVSGDDIVLEYLYFGGPDEIHSEVGEGLGATAFWSKLPLKENEGLKKLKDEL
ncbi:Carboxylesterase family [Popillia japonica]|uniref:Carboxylic ester hydrolase n=1 Tax=Popillia japonica TaxID=7064 RepID=A0AAW1MLM0_POPJA